MQSVPSTRPIRPRPRLRLSSPAPPSASHPNPNPDITAPRSKFVTTFRLSSSTGGEKPKTLNKEWQEASTQLAVDQKMDPFTGPASEGYKGKYTLSDSAWLSVEVLTASLSWFRQGLRSAVDVQFVIELGGVDQTEHPRAKTSTVHEAGLGDITAVGDAPSVRENGDSGFGCRLGRVGNGPDTCKCLQGEAWVAQGCRYACCTAVTLSTMQSAFI